MRSRRSGVIKQLANLLAYISISAVHYLPPGEFLRYCCAGRPLPTTYVMLNPSGLRLSPWYCGSIETFTCFPALSASAQLFSNCFHAQRFKFESIGTMFSFSPAPFNNGRNQMTAIISTISFTPRLDLLVTISILCQQGQVTRNRAFKAGTTIGSVAGRRADFRLLHYHGLLAIRGATGSALQVFAPESSRSHGLIAIRVDHKYVRACPHEHACRKWGI